MKTVDWDLKRNYIIENLSALHDLFYHEDKIKFTGPSLYFHRKTIDLKNQGVFDQNYCESIYATVVSWGMHRMGPKGAKMRYFDVFSTSILSQKSDIAQINAKTIYDINESLWEKMFTIFCKIEIMDSDSILVGNSKVLAHLFPNIIAPIDREYTMNYIFGSKQIPKSKESQFDLFRSIHETFYYEILKNNSFRKNADAWVKNQEKYKWDTSLIKIIDNLVIATKKYNGVLKC
jgi:hypothetical protein